MENNKIIFINGCFDLLHRGHIELFQYAKKLGKYLIVAIDSDSRVKELKGSSRPINNQFDRMFMLLSIKYVDEVKIFSNQNELEKYITSRYPKNCGDVEHLTNEFYDKRNRGIL